MGRRPRIELPGGIYHVIQRGNNRDYIFEQPQDKEDFLDFVRLYRQKLGFGLYAYVIMDNHYHLMVQPSDWPLQTIMQRLLSHYVRDYNKTHCRSGYLFGGRYRAITVLNEGHLFSLLRYIHQNPVAARICQKTSDYPWSSDPIYRKNDRAHSLVQIDFILNRFSEDRQKALLAYCQFMDSQTLEDLSLIQDIQEEERLESQMLADYLTRPRTSLEAILRQVTPDRRIYEAILKGSRKRNLTPYKRRYIQAALAQGYTMAQIASSMGISAPAVWQLIEGSGIGSYA